MNNEKTYSFQKLWHLLLDKNMTKRELAARANVSVASLGRLKKGIPLSYARMNRIKDAVGVEDFTEIMEEIKFD